MTALTKDRDTAVRDGDYVVDPVAAGKKIFAGALVVINATGYAEPGSTATTLIARGRAEEQVDNSAGADGDLTIKVQRNRPFKFVNDGTVTRTDIGSNAYIVDDQTVANSDGGATRSVAGEIVDVEADGVWVWIK